MELFIGPVDFSDLFLCIYLSIMEKPVLNGKPALMETFFWSHGLSKPVYNGITEMQTFDVTGNLNV